MKLFLLFYHQNLFEKYTRDSHICAQEFALE